MTVRFVLAHEVFEQSELARLKFNLLAAAPHLAREQVHGQVAHRQARRLRGVRRAADERLDARQQFGEGERLCQIIVAAGLQAPHAVIHGGLGAEDQHRDVDVLGAELLDEAQAVELGQHDIHDGGVVGDGLGQGQGTLAIRSNGPPHSRSASGR